MTRRRRSNVTLPRDRESIRLVHHPDAERKRAYDRESPVGRLHRALHEAREKGWILVHMAREWRVVYAWEASS